MTFNATTQPQELTTTVSYGRPNNREGISSHGYSTPSPTLSEQLEDICSLFDCKGVLEIASPIHMDNVPSLNSNSSTEFAEKLEKMRKLSSNESTQLALERASFSTSQILAPDADSKVILEYMLTVFDQEENQTKCIREARKLVRMEIESLNNTVKAECLLSHLAEKGLFKDETSPTTLSKLCDVLNVHLNMERGEEVELEIALREMLHTLLEFQDSTFSFIEAQNLLLEVLDNLEEMKREERRN